MPEYTVGTIENFPEGEGRAVDVGGLDVAVFNLDGDLFAIHNNCPHKNLPLADAGRPRFVEGPDPATETRGEVDPAACTIKCPWHRLNWDLTDGHNDLLDYEIPTYDVVVKGDEVRVRRQLTVTQNTLELTDYEEGIVRISLDRPDVHNAQNLEMLEELVETFDE